MRQGDPIAVAFTSVTTQFYRVGHEVELLRALACVEHRRMADQGSDRAVMVEFVLFVAIPAAGVSFRMWRSACAILRRQVVQPRVLLMQPLHRHGTAIGPAIAAFRGLLDGSDGLVLDIKEEGETLGLAWCWRGVRLS